MGFRPRCNLYPKKAMQSRRTILNLSESALNCAKPRHTHENGVNKGGLSFQQTIFGIEQALDYSGSMSISGIRFLDLIIQIEDYLITALGRAPLVNKNPTILSRILYSHNFLRELVQRKNTSDISFLMISNVQWYSKNVLL